MYKIVLFILLFSFQIAFSNNIQNVRILEPDEKLHRQDFVLEGYIYIRFHPQYKQENIILNRFQDFELVKPMIYNNKSITQSKTPIRKTINHQKVLQAEEPLLRTFLVRYSEAIPPEEFIKKIISKYPEIEIAEPYYVPQILGKFIPNDSLVPEQKMLETISAFEAWAIYQGDSNVVIGISDSGIWQEHEDLVGSFWVNKNEIPNTGRDDDGNGYVDDYMGVNFTWELDGSDPSSTYNHHEGHGTGVAGIAGARVNNELGIAGVGFNTKMFPMKTMREDEGGILFGYESMLYAADMGFQVLNCSWGGPSFSEINKTIVDYAVAKDVAIVAAAGNHGSLRSFYPAGYPGVLAVGVSNPNDSVMSMSALGTAVRIIAPGQETITTSNYGGYGSFCCTSGASPIVAAAVGLIRGLHPNLSGLQALEFAKLCIDNISAKNKKIAKIVPGRINLLKCVTLDPFSIPGISPFQTEFFTSNDNKTGRFLISDTIYLRIYADNFLGEANDVKFKLSIAVDDKKSIALIDSVIEFSKISAESMFIISDFSFTVEQYNNETVFLRVDIESGNFKDFFLVSFIPSITYSIFSNDIIRFGMSDLGRIGFSDPPYNENGIGFIRKDFDNILFEGGLIAVEDARKVVCQVRKPEEKTKSDFMSIKPFLPPQPNYAVISDGLANDSNRIGLQIEIKVDVAPDMIPCVKFNYRIANISGNTLNNIALGTFFDWDIGRYGLDNYALLFPEAIPPIYQGKDNIAAGISGRYEDEPLIGMLVYSDFSTAVAQYATMNNQITFETDGFNNEKKIQFLNSRTDSIFYNRADIAAIAGMKFNGEFGIADTLEFQLCICCDYTKKKLRDYLWLTLDSSISNVSEFEQDFYCRLFPNPATNELIIESEEPFVFIEIFNLSGKLMLSQRINNPTNSIRIPLDDLSSAVYFISIQTGTKRSILPFIKR